MRELTGFAKINNLEKPHILIYRELGYKTLFLKGFDNMNDLRGFIKENKDRFIYIKRLEGEK